MILYCLGLYLNVPLSLLSQNFSSLYRALLVILSTMILTDQVQGTRICDGIALHTYL